jgi:hypothetical protein
MAGPNFCSLHIRDPSSEKRKAVGVGISLPSFGTNSLTRDGKPSPNIRAPGFLPFGSKG